MIHRSACRVPTAAAVLGVLCLLSAGGLRAADPVQAGSAYIHTQPEKSRNINPQPFFVDTATVTENMREAGAFGTRVDRLHSWAGWMLWGNNVTDYQKVDNDGAHNATDKLVQGALLAGPIGLKYINTTRPTARTYGEWPGLEFGAPVGTLGVWENPAYNHWPNSRHTRGIVHRGAFYPLVRAYPATANTDAEPAWLSDNAVTDRMGDWDIEMVLERPAPPPAAGRIVSERRYAKRRDDRDPAAPETIRLTMAQGSPFAWFAHTGWAAGSGMQFVVKRGDNLAARQLAAIDLGDRTAAVNAGLGCYLLEIREMLLAGADALGTNPKITVYRYMAVFYDKSTTAAVPAQIKTVGTAESQGVFLSPAPSLPAGTAWHYVIAALPLVEYPYDDARAPTRDEARTHAGAWAVALAPYAFNAVTDTQVAYQVHHDRGILSTTYTAATAAVGPVGAAADGHTVFCLMPHHYEDFNDGQGGAVFAGKLSAAEVKPVNPAGEHGPFWGRMPAANNGFYPFWTAHGALKPIHGKSFGTNYVLAHILPYMPPIPEGKQATLPGSTTKKYIWEAINWMACWDWTAALQMYPPMFTELDGGGQAGLYKSGGQLRRIAATLPILKSLAEQPSDDVGKPASDIAFSAIRPQWGYTSKPSYDRKDMFGFAMKGIHDFLDLATRESATMRWGSGGNPQAGQANPDCPVFFMYDADLGAVLYYPGNTALVCPSGCANTGTGPGGGLAYIAQPADLTGLVEDTFELNSHFADYHYNYGWLTMAASQAAWQAPLAEAPYTDMFHKDHFGTLIDQLVMTVAHDPELQVNPQVPDAQKFWTVDGFTYSKFNYFDQWLGQPWTDGVPSASGTQGVADWEGKNDNAFGEAYQMYAAMVLWGQATGRQAVADLGLYLATTMLYNYQAYWADHLQIRVPEETYTTPTYTPGEARWSARGDWVPSANCDGPSSVHYWTRGTTFWSGWWYWGVTPETATKENYSAWSMKIHQAAVIQQSMYGDAMPLGARDNGWIPQSAHTLDFVRGSAFQKAALEILNSRDIYSQGWDYARNQGLKTYVASVNQMRALLGLDTVYKDPRPDFKAQNGLSPWQWIWSMTCSGTQADRNNLVNNFLDDRQTPVELINFFWVLDQYGAPDATYFGYSKAVAVSQGQGQAVVQPAAAVFYHPDRKLYTVVACNPNDTDCTVNWWRVGQSTSQDGLLDEPLTVPKHGYAVKTVLPPHH